MRFRLLGPVEVAGPDGNLPLGGRKQRSVLALLALSANRVVAVDRLVSGVWGDEASDRAGATLQVYVSTLRRILREGGASATIEGRSPGYVLHVPPHDVDVNEFARLVEQGRAALDSDSALGARLLRDGLALWRGTPLADLADEPFSGPEIVRLEQARLAALEDRLEADLSLGRQREVVGELEGLVTEHPLRERLWGQLIVALYRDDRQADALAAYGRAREVLADELGIDPGPALQELERAVLRQELDVDVPTVRPASVAPPVRLPVPVGRTIGRGAEIDDLADEFARGGRLLTLTGPGGSGKTRLSIALAQEIADRFPGGVYFVDLTAITEPADVMPSIARTLGVTDPGAEDALDGVSATLADRESTLLLLDNLEHVIVAATAVAELLTRVPRLRVLVSSQIPLRVAGEVEYRVPGLPVPRATATLDEIGGAESVRLFVDRARAVRPGFTLDAVNAHAVAEVCRRLDGLPLAVELAAARLRLLSLDTIVARLDDSLGLLTSGPRDAPERQRTLRAAIGWSIDLLPADTRRVLGRLSVFAGEFDVAAAIAVGGQRGEADLETLVENSLVRSADDEILRLPEAVRQFARDTLLPVAERDEAITALYRHYVSVAEDLRRLVDGPRAGEATSVVDRQLANFRLAFEESLASGATDIAARLALALAPFLLVLGRAGDALNQLRAVLSVVKGPPHEVAVRAAAGRIAYQLNDLDAAQQWLEAALADAGGLSAEDATVARCVLAAIASARDEQGASDVAESALAEAEESGHYVPRVFARSVLAIAAARRGDFALEKELYEQRLDLARARDDRIRIADTLTVLGEIAFDEQDYPQAGALVREAFVLCDGFRGPESRDALIMLGRIAVADNDPDRAASVLDEALRRSVAVGQPAALALCLRVHAAAATVQSDLVRAARLFGAGEAAQPASVPVNPAVEADIAARRVECRSVLGDQAFDREYRHGAALDITRAAALAAAPATSQIAV